MSDVPGKKNWGLRLKILLVVAVFMGLLFLMYSWIAFAPTGYQEIEAKQSEAVKRIAEEMKPVATTSRANETKQPEIRVIPMKDTGWSVTRPLPQQQLLSTMELGMSREASADEIIAKTKSLLPELMQYSAAQRYARTYDIAGAAKTDKTALLDSIEDILLHSACDLRMIPNPLGNPNKPNQHAPFETVQNGDNVLFLAADAVRRACRSNQPDKAVELLEKLTELTRQLHLNEFPNGGAHLAPLQELLLDLGHTPEFPADGFARARAILDRAHLDETKLDEIKAAYIAQVGGKQLEFIRNSSIERGDGGNIATPPKQPQTNTTAYRQTKRFQSNDWHYFMDGNVEKTGFNILKPVLIRTMERGFVAMANGDPDGILSAQEQVVTICKWMNLQPGDIPVLLPLENFYAHNYYELRDIKNEKSRVRRTMQKAAEDWRESTVGRKFNEQIDMTRLMLAYAHFSRVNNRPPVSVSELIPKYLDPSFTANKTILYEVTQTKPHHGLNYPRLRDRKEIQAHPFFVVSHRIYSKPTPVRSLSYEMMIGEAQTDAERKAVEEAKGPFIPSSTVLCQIRALTQLRSDWMRKYIHDEQPRGITPEQMTAMKKAQTEALEKIFGDKEQATFIAITAVADTPTSGTR